MQPFRQVEFGNSTSRVVQIRLPGSCGVLGPVSFPRGDYKGRVIFIIDGFYLVYFIGFILMILVSIGFLGLLT